VHKLKFYRTEAGREIVLEFLRSLDPSERQVIGSDLRTVELGFPLGLPLCRSLGGGLWEVRSTLPSKREARLIFFHQSSEQALVVLHAFIKKTRKTPEPDLKLATARKREFVR
jgi:phage-related protein